MLDSMPHTCPTRSAKALSVSPSFFSAGSHWNQGSPCLDCRWLVESATSLLLLPTHPRLSCSAPSGCSCRSPLELATFLQAFPCWLPRPRLVNSSCIPQDTLPLSHCDKLECAKTQIRSLLCGAATWCAPTIPHFASYPIEARSPRTLASPLPTSIGEFSTRTNLGIVSGTRNRRILVPGLQLGAFDPFGDLLRLAASFRLTELAEPLRVFGFQSHCKCLPWL